MSSPARLHALRLSIAALQNPGSAPGARPPVLSLGDARLDGALAGGGLPLGCWHEAAGEGLEIETAAAAAAFVATLAAPLLGAAGQGAAVWILRRDDLYAPGLASLGFSAGRLIQVRAPSEASALAALEEALATPGVAVAVAEVGSTGLTAGRRLQLACEKTGATGFCLRRRPFGSPVEKARSQPARAGGSAATTRWRIAPAPSQPAPGEPGLGPPRWRVELERSRGGRPGAWLLEKSDGTFPLRVVAELGDRQRATTSSWRLAG